MAALRVRHRQAARQREVRQRLPGQREEQQVHSGAKGECSCTRCYSACASDHLSGSSEAHALKSATASTVDADRSRVAEASC